MEQPPAEGTGTTMITTITASVEVVDDEATRWHAEIEEMARRRGDANRVPFVRAQAEELRREGLSPQRACLVLF